MLNSVVTLAIVRRIVVLLGLFASFGVFNCSSSQFIAFTKRDLAAFFLLSKT